MKKHLIVKWTLCFLLIAFSTAAAGSVFVYKKPKVDHPGEEITPLETYAMIKKDPAHIKIVDVRTRAEYQFIGHPEGAYLVPLKFFSNTFKKKGYLLVDNTSFSDDIMKRFDPKADKLFFLCRSGTRAAIALNAVVKAGWSADRVYVILGGFEGGKLKDKNSVFNGQRSGGGWRNEGLPWTYSMDPKLVY